MHNRVESMSLCSYVQAFTLRTLTLHLIVAIAILITEF